ncbi:MAG: tyrosine--tRNA ligase [Actinobacteria bacterium]|nr:tyrosine--tRNA ligase [Actinomycetota bacterium]MBI3687673.1 tyrosine--tRNA ligase [Actinomycetota bacterium]
MPPHLRAGHDLLAAGTAQILPATGLAEKLLTADREGRPLRVKLGIDPSGSELTLGHAVVLRKLRQFQELGHLVVLIVGDFTGRVGDPTGRSQVRQLLTAEQTERNSRGYVEQLMLILDPDRVELRRNSEWLAGMTMVDVIGEAAHLTVAQLLERDDFAVRWAARQPISLVEFLYPLLQGTDSVAVEADIEVGGTDQTYNLLVGRDLQRAHGRSPQTVLTLPLLEGTDGTQKMSKSLGNYIAISEPANDQFGKAMSIPDPLTVRYAELCTDLSAAQVAEIAVDVAKGGAAAGAAKRRVAREIVTLYRGVAAAVAAEEHFNALFRDHRVPQDLAEHRIGQVDPVHLPGLLVDLGFAPSTSAARRLLDQGAVRVGDRRVEPGRYDLPRAELDGAVLSAGKRRQARLTS